MRSNLKIIECFHYHPSQQIKLPNRHHTNTMSAVSPLATDSAGIRQRHQIREVAIPNSKTDSPPPCWPLPSLEVPDSISAFACSDRKSVPVLIFFLRFDMTSYLVT